MKKKNEKFVIKILHSPKCFQPGSFFQNTLEFNLTKTREHGDLVTQHGSKLVLMCNGQNLDHLNDIRFVSRLLGLGEPIRSFDPNIVPNMAMAFWDGNQYEALGELADQNAPFIAEHLSEAEEKKIIIVSRFPNFKYRAKQKINLLRQQKKEPTFDTAMDKAIELHKESSELRNLLTWRDQERPVNPDTGVEYTKEEQDERYELYRAVEFNCNLYKAIAQELSA